MIDSDISMMETEEMEQIEDYMLERGMQIT